MFIEPFRPARPLHKLSNKMFIPSHTLERMRVRDSDFICTWGLANYTWGLAYCTWGACKLKECPLHSQEEARTEDKAIEAAVAAEAVASHSGLKTSVDIVPTSSFQLWTDEELAAAKRVDPTPSQLADAFGAAMTLLYAKYQAEVGRKVSGRSVVRPGMLTRSIKSWLLKQPLVSVTSVAFICRQDEPR